MGLFDIFKKKPKFVDELFGEMGYTTFRDSSKNYYTGTIIFDSQQIEICIDADENGPSQGQKEFFSDLLQSYNTLKSGVIIPFLKKELDTENEEQIVDFMTKIDGMSIQRIIEKPEEWSLTFYSATVDHYITVDFVGMQPQEGVTIDG